jgi:hypothetical protein
MPTRFCLKKKGNPSSMIITIATKINIGEKKIIRINPKNLLSIIK